MNQKSTGFVFAAVLLCTICAWGQGASSGMSGTYANIEASSLRKRPQDAWARSIAFRDSIVAGEPGNPQRLDRRTYVPIELQSAGTAWVREDLHPPFAALPAGTEFTFGGTVDQFNRRYYLILDAAYQVDTLPTQEERWTDVLANPPVPPALDVLADATGDLPSPAEAPEDTDVPSWGDVMSGIAELSEPAPVSEPEVEAEPEPFVEEEPFAETELEEVFAEADAFGTDDLPDSASIPEDSGNLSGEEGISTGSGDEESVAEADMPSPLPIEVAEVPPAIEDMEGFDFFEETETDVSMAEPENIGEELLPGETVAEEIDVVETVEAEPVDEPELPDVASVESETFAEAEPETVPDDGAASIDDQEPFEEYAGDVEAEQAGEPGYREPEETAASDSYHVAPMDEPAPIALVPLVSLQPTRAELAAQEARRREAERQEVLRKKEAVRQAKIEAKRQREAEAKRAKAEAAARKKAEAEARAELERARREAEAARRAEEQRLREEEAQALAAMEAREAQEREAAAQAAAREALQKERDDLAARIEAEKASLAERSRMAQEVLAAEQAAREEAERAAREDAERQKALLAEKAQMEADLAALAEQEAELEASLAAGQAAREEAERIAQAEAERAEQLAAQERAAAEQLAAAQASTAEREAADRAARRAAKQAAKQARRERAAAERAAAEAEMASQSAEPEIAEPEAVQASGPAVSDDDVPDWMKPVFF